MGAQPRRAGPRLPQHRDARGAAALLVATIAALVWANSPWSDSYESVWTTELSIRLGGSGISHDLRALGQRGPDDVLLPRRRARGQARARPGPAARAAPAGDPRGSPRSAGMAVPVAIYLAFNAGGARRARLGRGDVDRHRVRARRARAAGAAAATRLRVRLLTLAVVDDLVALIVIATAYTEHVVARPAAGGGRPVRDAVRAALRARRVAPAGGRGASASAVWVALLEVRHRPGDRRPRGRARSPSAYPPARVDLERVDRADALVPRAADARSSPARRSSRVASAISPNERLQYRLHPWTSFVIVPLFALANAGIHVDGSLLARRGHARRSRSASSSATWSASRSGSSAATWLAYRALGRRVALALSWPVLAGGGTVAGIGFTVSLLISSIAFDGRQLEEAKLGVLALGRARRRCSRWAAFRVIALLPDAACARASCRAPRTSSSTSPRTSTPSATTSAARDDAPVTLVEYGDYECPYCGQAEVVIRELLDSFGDDLRYVWRHLPLNDVHPNAQMAAEAAEAAAAQGAFWEYARPAARPPGRAHAARPGAPRGGARARRRRASGTSSAAASTRTGSREDVASADASGVAGTPTLLHQRPAPPRRLRRRRR